MQLTSDVTVNAPARNWRVTSLLTHLRAAGEPDEEVEAEEKRDEDLAVFLDPRELVAQRRDDRLRAAELQPSAQRK